MESKRKVNGAGMSATQEAEDRASKRRRLPNGDDQSAETTTRLGTQLIDSIKKLAERNGRLVAEDFLFLPPKRELPEYYDIIRMPVALGTIESKLRQKQLSSLSELESLFHRMVDNAKFFNEEGSGIVEDANRILKAVTTFMKKENPAYKTPGYTPKATPIPGEEKTAAVDAEEDTVMETPSTKKKSSRHSKGSNASAPVAATESTGKSDTTFDGMNFQKAQEYIMTNVLDHKKDEQDEFSAFEPFVNLPSRALKDYYQAIPHPISLKGLQKRVRGVQGRNDPTGISEFKTWAAFEEEASYIWKNAWHYNEDGSEISVLASELENHFGKLCSLAKKKISPEVTGGPKLKLKVSATEPKPAPEPTPTPKITLRMGAKASPAESPAPITTKEEPVVTPSVVLKVAPAVPATSITIAPTLAAPDRARSIPGPVASPSPSIARLVKNEEGSKPSSAVSNIASTLTTSVAALPNGASSSAQANGSVMAPPGTPVNSSNPATTVAATQPSTPLYGGFQGPPRDAFDQLCRQPGKTAADAMITMLTVTTHPGLNIDHHYRWDYLPDDDYAQTTFVNHLRACHYFVQIKPVLAHWMLDREHKMFVTLNGQRLFAMPLIPGQPVDLRQPLFDARLVPGSNRVDIEVISAIPKDAKLPSYGSRAELEKMAVVLFVTGQ